MNIFHRAKYKITLVAEKIKQMLCKHDEGWGTSVLELGIGRNSYHVVSGCKRCGEMHMVFSGTLYEYFDKFAILYSN